MVSLNRSRSLDAVTCINFLVLTRFLEMYAIQSSHVMADTGNLLAESVIMKPFDFCQEDQKEDYECNSQCRHR